MTPADVPVAILAGGRATRLGSLTAERPKALMPVAGRPFVEHQLELLRQRGVRKVVLCIGHLGEQIVDHLGDGSRFGLRVEYSFDGPELMGTAGALRRAEALLGPRFWVLYGDSYLDFDYEAAARAFEERPEPALMTVYKNEGRWDTSNVVYRDGRVLVYDKRRPRPDMAYIDYGAGLLRAAALGRVAADKPTDLGDLYHDLASEGLLAGYEVDSRFYEIGSVDGWQETDRHLAQLSRRSHA